MVRSIRVYMVIARTKEKTTTLIVQNPMTVQGVTAAAVTDLLRRWKWEDLDHPTLLTRYESMRLRSLRQSERTAARDPVQHKS